jgi:hypothetical protein
MNRVALAWGKQTHHVIDVDCDLAGYAASSRDKRTD